MCTLETLRRVASTLLPDVYLFDAVQNATNPALGNALGIIIQPGPHNFLEYATLAMTNTEEIANLWGHTALYVRHNGEIVRYIGFDPNRLAMFSRTGLEVSSGRGGTTGYYYDEGPMFRSPDAVVLEFPLSSLNAIDDSLWTFHLNEMLDLIPRPGTGLVPHNLNLQYLQTYVTRDGQRYQGAFDPMLMGNCINSIVQVMTGSNLVLSYQGRDLGSAQGRLTRDVIQNAGQFALNDLDHGLLVAPHRSGSLMQVHQRVIRRATGLVTTLNVIGLALQLTGRVRNQPGWLLPGYLSLLNLVISFLIEAVPSNSRMWRVPTRTLQMFVAVGAKVFTLLALYRNREQLFTGMGSYLYWLNSFYRR
jgi:hypothetical protein